MDAEGGRASNIAWPDVSATTSPKWFHGPVGDSAHWISNLCSPAPLNVTRHVPSAARYSNATALVPGLVSAGMLAPEVTATENVFVARSAGVLLSVTIVWRAYVSTCAAVCVHLLT